MRQSREAYLRLKKEGADWCSTLERQIEALRTENEQLIREKEDQQARGQLPSGGTAQRGSPSTFRRGSQGGQLHASNNHESMEVEGRGRGGSADLDADAEAYEHTDPRTGTRTESLKREDESRNKTVTALHIRRPRGASSNEQFSNGVPAGGHHQHSSTMSSSPTTAVAAVTAALLSARGKGPQVFSDLGTPVSQVREAHSPQGNTELAMLLENAADWDRARAELADQNRKLEEKCKELEEEVRVLQNAATFGRARKKYSTMTLGTEADGLGASVKTTILHGTPLIKEEFDWADDDLRDSPELAQQIAVGMQRPVLGGGVPQEIPTETKAVAGREAEEALLSSAVVEGRVSIMDPERKELQKAVGNLTRERGDLQRQVDQAGVEREQLEIKVKDLEESKAALERNMAALDEQLKKTTGQEETPEAHDRGSHDKIVFRIDEPWPQAILDLVEGKVESALQQAETMNKSSEEAKLARFEELESALATAQGEVEGLQKKLEVALDREAALREENLKHAVDKTSLENTLEENLAKLSQLESELATEKGRFEKQLEENVEKEREARTTLEKQRDQARALAERHRNASLKLKEYIRKLEQNSAR
ncbi:unnamed protein product [Amoebophrya sp. A25]|nr:unnamed protein product [Amoebophrya sp. A25]|eukprot:GSA25T00002951001.1